METDKGSIEYIVYRCQPIEFRLLDVSISTVTMNHDVTSVIYSLFRYISNEMTNVALLPNGKDELFIVDIIHRTKYSMN